MKPKKQTIRFGLETATHHCRACGWWGDADEAVWDKWGCKQCGEIGFVVLNPFRDNMVPYIIFNPTKQDNKRKV